MDSSSLRSPKAALSYAAWLGMGRGLFEQERHAAHKTQVRYIALETQVRALLKFTESLQSNHAHLMRREDLQLQEFEHRVFNGLQLIVSTLTSQSRAAATPETALQLSIAAGRVAAVASVHRRLRSLDAQESVALKEHLQDLCADLSALLFEERSDRAVVLQCADLHLPTVLSIPLGLIVSELVTNAAKHAKGNVTIHVKSTSHSRHLLSVGDDGPGIPARFDPAKSKGLGMKILLALVKQIGGELHILPADSGRGSHFNVTFSSPDYRLSASSRAPAIMGGA